MEDTNTILSQFASQRKKPVFIDKSLLLANLNQRIDFEEKFLCVTMPSRFGKTYIAQMIAAYYTNRGNSKSLFQDLAIAGEPSFEKHLNKHNVIKLDIAGICADVEPNLMNDAIKKAIRDRFFDLFPNMGTDADSIPSLFLKAKREINASFVVVIDEWDYILRNHAETPEFFDKYLDLLRSLLLNSDLSPCFEFVYMTGIMPIKRYKTMSALNEFDEATMVFPEEFAPFFGFSSNDVETVMKQSKTRLKIEDLRSWYDGYYFERVGEVFCPNSVVLACLKNSCRTYFGSSMALTAVKESLKNNRIDLEKDAAILLSGSSVEVNARLFDSDLSNLNSREKGLAALVHSGFLSYNPKTQEAIIPNKEVRLFFSDAVSELSWPALNSPISESRRLLEKTKLGDAGFVEKAFDEFHLELSSILTKNHEDVLATIAFLLYYAAKEDYYAFKEPATGLGRADILFVPISTNEPAIIIELKVDDNPESCLEQIERMKYYNEIKNHVREVILVGIVYDRSTLRHKAEIKTVTLN